MVKIKVGIIGGAGYTGGELIRLLLNHPGVEISFIHSRSKPAFANGNNPNWMVVAKQPGFAMLYADFIFSLFNSGKP